jgi:hypothetical protein
LAIGQEKISKNPHAKTVLEDLLEHSDDPDLQAAFRVQLRKVLENDAELRKQLRSLVKKEEKRMTKNIVQTGSGNIAVQGSNNTINQKIGQVAHTITNVGYQPKQIPQQNIPEFLDLMQSLPPLKIHVTASMMDPETRFLANQLVELLGRAGWDVSGDSLSIYEGLPKGIVFLANEPTLSLDILTKFLKAVGFTNYAHFDNSRDSVTIVVNGVV